MNLEVNIVATAPVLAPLLAAVLVLVLDAALPRQRLLHLVVAALGLAGGAVAAVPGLLLGTGDRTSSFCLPGGACLYSVDRLAGALQVAGLVGALVVLALVWQEWSRPSPTDRTAVVVALLLGATGGTVALPAAGDLATLLVALELATVPTIALVVLTDHVWSAERRARAVDGAMALLTTSLVSFCLLAMGAALWVAATGSALLPAPEVRQPSLMVLAAVFMLAGLAFKVSAVPFHAWTPITYAAAPLPVTAYLATVSKVAALGALVVLVRARAGEPGLVEGPMGIVGGPTFWAVGLVAALSMTVGNLVALVQKDTVRLLAWSTVAQAGWVLLPLAAISSRAARAAGSYLLVYLAATLLAFVVVIALAKTRGSQDSSIPLESHRGLLHRRPLMALPLGLALLTLAGLPPGIAGLIAKVVALRPVVGDGLWWLAVVAAVNVVLGIAVYLRWLVVLLDRSGAATAAATVGGAEFETPAEAQGTDAGDGESGAEIDGGDNDDGGGSVTRWIHGVLIGLLTALLVLGSIVPIGII